MPAILPTPNNPSRTWAHQSQLPNLPVPPLEDTCRRYLEALKALQDEKEHEITKRAVQAFLRSDGPRVQQSLIEYAKNKPSYIEEFWYGRYDSYLQHSDSVVLNLNPFFVLENDPTPSRSSQLPRAASLIISSLGFIHDLRTGILEPDTVRGIPLDMDQYKQLFGTARIPTDHGCKMETASDSTHIIVLRRGQFYWFDVLDDKNRLLLSEREILRNLQAIVADADKLPVTEVAKNALGVLTTENRKIWSSLRYTLSQDRSNAACLNVVDRALFAVCLDDATPEGLAELCGNYLCGTYKLVGGVQVGTCTNRWYDKLQIIVTADGAAGINFEHTGVDGHTVLRFAADIFTEGLMLLARSINPKAPTLFHLESVKPSMRVSDAARSAPKKLEWAIENTPTLRAGIRFAETRLSDLICQNECEALEFRGFGKIFITSHGFSPDAFVQMAFQAAYFGMYGRIECTYEPAMTKSFLHGRTEAIRTVQPESVNFVKTFFSEATAEEKINALRRACKKHVELTKECSKGHGQDRHLYALYCLLQREFETSSDVSTSSSGSSGLPEIFRDGGWATLSTSILSTSNCGNPALRLFGFGPVSPDGYGLGYIIKDDGLSVCAASKHLQTRRFLDTLQGYLEEVQRVLVTLVRAANERPEPFVDHAGILRDSKTGRRINGAVSDEEDDEDSIPSYSFFDSYDVELLGRRNKRPERHTVGKAIPLVEY